MKTERTGLLLVNLLLLFALCLFMSSCVTYSRFLKKFGHVGKDSTRILVRDTLITQWDTIRYGIKTDTTLVHEVFQQGRARLTYDRNRLTTSVKAECEPDTVVKVLQANCPPVASFGIAPWYKTAFFVTLALLGIAFVSYVFLYHLKLTLAKR